MYASRSITREDRRADDVQAILARARNFNASAGITGLLTVSQDRYLQLLDGPADAVGELYQRICADTRHAEIELLTLRAVSRAAFPDWSMGHAERLESSAALDARVRQLKTRLGQDAEVTGADFFRFLLMPGLRGDAVERRERVTDVLFFSPSPLWGPAVLQRVALESSSRPARTTLVGPGSDGGRLLVEYVDTHVPEVGPARALSLTGADPDVQALVPLLDRLDLVVLMLSPSDVASVPAHARFLSRLASARGRRTDVLLVSSIGREQLDMVSEALQGACDDIALTRLRLSGAEDIWRAAKERMRAAASAPSASSEGGPNDAWRTRAGALVAQAMSIEGALAAAVAMLDSTRIVASAKADDAHSVDLPGLARFARAKYELVHRLVAGDDAEEIILTTTRHLLLMRLLPIKALGEPSCLLLALDRNALALGTARLKLAELVAAAT